MSEPSSIGTFLGEPIESLSRDRLYEVIKYLSKELDKYRVPDMSRAIALGRVEMMKRGETFQ